MQKIRNSCLVIFAVAALVLAGCAGKPVSDDSAASSATDGGQTIGVVPGDDVEIIIEDVSSGADGANQVLVTRSDGSQVQLDQNVIYFDYDTSELREEFNILLQAHANFLAANPETRVTIEGHADERGTREYNLALGENRAFKVKQFLLLQGASKTQIDTVSMGEEKPDIEGHDESAWSKNRRAVFIYSAN